MSFFHSRDTEAPKVTFPAASHAMLPDAICPEPSLFSFHFVPFVTEPSLPSETFPLVMAAVPITHPAIWFEEPRLATQAPALFVA